MKKLLSYPATILFFLFIFVFAALDMSAAPKERSELENRPLAQKPVFQWKALLKNEYTPKYETYVNDQFVFRAEWIDLKSRSEYALGKLENNDIVYGKDHYQFAKLFSVDQTQYQKNVTAINAFAKKHPGLVTTMVVPSASLVLQEKLPAHIPFANENACLDEIYTGLAENTKVIDLRETLNAHKDEYIYYRTDHHWTTYGAYLAYLQYASAKGLTPLDLSKYQSVEVKDFYGTNYSKSKLFNTLPDTLTYYEIPGQLIIDGVQQNGLYDLSKLDTRDKYAAFLYGNNGLTSITGAGTGNCLVIKDSYANCFVPFLTANYAKIDVVDLRTMSQSMEELVAQGSYSDILILYNFQSFQSDNNLVKLMLT